MKVVSRFLMGLVFWFLSLLSPKVIAYPEFMSYGYNTCLACHYNATGGGPLSDYGRGLFAVEIAQKPFYNSKLTDEDLTRLSGFLGPVKIPFIKPYAKLRYLSMNTDFEERPIYSNRKILMQSAIGSSFIFDENEKYFATFEFGYAPTPQAANPANKKETNKYISREYYFRYNNNDTNWIYFGFMDKPYSIKSPDHSSFSRGQLGFGQNDQAHGIMWHHLFEAGELFTFLYAGNLQQDNDVRLKGLSLMYEGEVSDTYRRGYSFTVGDNSYVQQLRLGHHQKYALSKGSILMFEAGLTSDKSKSTKTSTNGYYSTFNNNFLISKGVNFTTQLEVLNDNLKSNEVLKTKLGMGFLYFPMQRIELRTSIVKYEAFASKQQNEDSFTWLGQVHLSF